MISFKEFLLYETISDIYRSAGHALKSIHPEFAKATKEQDIKQMGHHYAMADDATKGSIDSVLKSFSGHHDIHGALHAERQRVKDTWKSPATTNWDESEKHFIQNGRGYITHGYHYQRASRPDDQTYHFNELHNHKHEIKNRHGIDDKHPVWHDLSDTFDDWKKANLNNDMLLKELKDIHTKHFGQNQPWHNQGVKNP